MSSAGHGHSESIAGLKLVPWLQCTAWAHPLHGHNTEASSVPGHSVTLHTHPTEHSQDPAAPLNPAVFPETLWHLSPVPAASLGAPGRLQLWLPSRAHHVLFPGPSSGHCSSTMSYLSPTASSWHHTAPLERLGPVPAPRARLGKQAGGDSFPKHLKETEPALSHARQVPDRS